MSSPIAMDEELENKKRKAAAEGARSTITTHFPVATKSPPSPPILKEERCSSKKNKDNETKDKVFLGVALSYLHLMIDIPSDRDYAERHHITLTRLLSAVKQADPKSVIVQYEASPKCSGEEIEFAAELCLDHPMKMPQSIT